MPSISGISRMMSPPYRWVRHPVTISARQRPRSFSRASSRMVCTDSSRARSMNAQVLTMRHSASSARSASGNPASLSSPSISSESTWFLGQPRVVRWTFMGRAKSIPLEPGSPAASVGVVGPGALKRPPPLAAGHGLLALALDRRLLVVSAPLHLLEQSVLLHLLLERLERGVDLIVDHLDSH